MQTTTKAHPEISAEVSTQVVRVLLARAQQLADSRPMPKYTAEWVEEASLVGDMTALAAAQLRAAA